MNKLLAVLIMIMLGLAFGGGALLANRSGFEAEPVVAALARQEDARAAQMEAAVETERAKSAAEWARANRERSETYAVEQAMPQRAAGLRLLAIGLPALALVAGAVLLAAGGRWAWRRAGAPLVVYPKNGVAPILSFTDAYGRRYVLDTGRGLGSVTAIDADGAVSLPLAGSEEAHGQLSAQSLASGVIAAVAGREDQTAAAAAVGNAVRDALGSLPALAQSGRPAVQPVFASRPDDGGEMRIIKRNVCPAPAQRDDVVKRGHFVEFLTRGSIIGFGRRQWAGEKFRDGTAVSQSLWAKVRKAAVDAGALTEAGELTRPVEETLQLLRLDDLAEDA